MYKDSMLNRATDIAQNEGELDHPIRRIISEAARFGINVNEREASLMMKHVLLVNEKNKVMNLTRITSINDAVDRHIIDSLLFLKGGEDISSVSKVLDIGTGAGFPGIPIAITTGTQVTMIDSVGKKINAVKEFCAKLGLDDRTECLHIRAEELAHKKRNEYDCVIARAVAEMRVLIEYSTPLLKDKGCLIASKGNIPDDEVEDAERTAQLCGLVLVSRETYELPNNSGHREIFTYEKRNKSKVGLPRKNGLAKSKKLY